MCLFFPSTIIKSLFIPRVAASTKLITKFLYLCETEKNIYEYAEIEPKYKYSNVVLLFHVSVVYIHGHQREHEQHEQELGAWSSRILQ